MGKARDTVGRRPAETATAAAGVAAFLVALGLDEAIAAWVALGVSLLPAVVSKVVDWWRARPA